jgi:hypothetical protein
LFSLNIYIPATAAPEVAAVAFCAAVGADGLGVGVGVALEEELPLPPPQAVIASNKAITETY